MAGNGFLLRIGALLDGALRNRLVDAVHALRGTILWATDGRHIIQLAADPTLALLVRDSVGALDLPLTSIVSMLQCKDGFPISPFVVVRL